MTALDTWLRALTTRARPATLPFTSGETDSAAAWMEVVGGPDALAERCRRSGAGEQLPVPDPASPLPEWTSPLRALFSGAPVPHSPADARLLQSQPRLPFDDALLPLVHHARTTLSQRADTSLLRPQAGASLERALLTRLTRWAAPVLQVEFDAFRAYEQAVAAPVPDSTTGGAESTALHDAFTAEFSRGRWRAVLDAHPVLARLLGVIVCQWTDASAEMLSRFAADRAAFPSTFRNEALTGCIASLTPSVSDPHHGGRTVAILTLTGGGSVVYKPRCVRLARAFRDAVSWLSDRGDVPDLRAPRVLARDGYGWMETVSPSPCSTLRDAATYYRRLGATLALLHLLGGTDVHRGNVIASGSYPQIVDLEGLLHPTLFVQRPPVLHPDLQQKLAASVLQTGLLPRPRLHSDGTVYDVSGLSDAPPLHRRIRAWSDVGTDAMTRSWRTVASPPTCHRPVVNGQAVPAADHISALVDGFRRGYDVLRRRRDTLLQTDGPLAGFRDGTVRVLVRNTRTYGSLLRRAFHSSHLTDAERPSIQLDALARPLLHDAADSALWPILNAERADLHRLDVPVFTMPATETTIYHRGQPLVERAFPDAPIDALTRRVRSLSAADRDVQVRFIEASFPVSASGFECCGQTSLSSPLALARTCADRLADCAVFTGEASAVPTWLHRRYDEDRSVQRLTVMDASLYRGVTGVAVFLAALARVDPSPVRRADARRLARSVLQPVRSALAVPSRDAASKTDSRAPALADAMGVGAGTGVASVVYGLCLAGRLLGDDALLRDAEAVSTLLTSARLQGAGADVISGVAGSILGLLALHDATGSDAALCRAREGGDLLLRTSIRPPGLPDSACAWATIDGVPRTGASHGASGIAAALFRLERATGCSRYRRAAIGALRFERTCFDAEARAWRPGPDLPFTAAPASGWCHGPPGAVLARLEAEAGGVDADEQAFVRDDLAAALHATSALGTAAPHSLCCGLAGRIDALLSTGRAFDRPDKISTAQAWMMDLCRFAATGDLSPRTRSAAFDPSLFQGIAGIGYTCLRVLHPDDLPSLLRWHLPAAPHSAPSTRRAAFAASYPITSRSRSTRESAASAPLELDSLPLDSAPSVSAVDSE